MKTPRHIDEGLPNSQRVNLAYRNKAYLRSFQEFCLAVVTDTSVVNGVGNSAGQPYQRVYCGSEIGKGLSVDSCPLGSASNRM